MNIKLWIPATALAVALLSGCGGGTDIKVQSSTSISKGQELTDLQRALDASAIDQKDYDKLRKIILKRENLFA
ncbi:MAG TPA: hypothetical protein VIU36_00945 [Gammaproteobacteria bacterium]|jgi:hypothetical protein